MKTGFSILGLAGVLALTGCGNKPQGPGIQLVTQIATSIRARGQTGQQSAAALDPRQSLSREMIDSAGQPLLLVIVEARDAAATLTEAGRNADKVTWLSAAGQSLTIRDGLVIATRALGHDLLGLDAPGGLSAIRLGQATQRTYEFLNGEDRVATMQVDCHMTQQTQETITVFDRAFVLNKLTESCRFGDETFENTYWFDADGTLRKSIQWVSFGVGTVELTWL